MSAVETLLRAFVGIAAISVILLASPAPTTAAPPPDLGPRGPHVAGFERFHRLPSDPHRVEGGLLLLGELGCLRCHAAEGDRAALVHTKPAPRLDDVAARVDPFWLRSFLADPDAGHSRATMPALLGHIPERERTAVAGDLVHFLVSRGPKDFRRTAPDLAAAERGERLYHEVGCVACHEPRRGAAGARTVVSVPLPGLVEKYDQTGLQRFISDPLATRPGGRMPDLGLSRDEARDVAEYLLRDTRVPGAVAYEIFRGHRRSLADETRMRRVRTGLGDAFDLSMRPGRGDVTVRFRSHLRVDIAGEYTFHLEVDDRGRLDVDGERVIDLDRTEREPPAKSASRRLEAGLHVVELEHFQWRGDVLLKLEWEGPGAERGPIPTERLRATREPIPEPAVWTVDPERAEEGRQLFGQLGCTYCHGLPGIPEERRSPPGPGVAELDLDAGCLSNETGSHPSYRLDAAQWRALRAALEWLRGRGAGVEDAATRVRRTLEVLDCHACHARNGRGGVTPERREFFLTDDEQIGEEGSVPPGLDGVGDKLPRDWLHAVIVDGAEQRPYMRTRMPRFGSASVAHLVDDLIALDRRDERLPASPDDPDVARAAGRALVDADALQCIVCHTFNRQPSLGIGAVDLGTMTERLTREWFHRFLAAPTSLKASTLMPDLWPEGESLEEDILDGDRFRQIDAIWTYLSDGPRAIFPEGLSQKSLELIVGGEAVVYRGKLWEAGWRAIAVGHPERLNLAFDAEEVRLALLWKGRFLNVRAHWKVQGMGRIRPIGDDVIVLAHGPEVARLENDAAPWPGESALRFRGYDLDDSRRPTFRFALGETVFADQAIGVEEESDVRLRRRVRVERRGESAPTHFRAWRGRSVDGVGDGRYRCDGELTITVRLEGAEPMIRTSRGEVELLVPLPTDGEGLEMILEYAW